MYSTASLQRALRLCNYDNLEIDGIYGACTTAAVRAAQFFYGITVDGDYGELTHAYLYEEVRAIQVKLQKLGFYNGELDAIVGDLTEGAAKSFQQANGLAADGLVGPLTNAKLNELCDYDEFATPNFTADEFKCDCGCGGDVIVPLKQKIQRVRDKIGLPFIITSGFRCPAINARDGGIADSLHLVGRAVDFQVPSAYRSINMIDQIADACHAEDLTVGYYYDTLFTHAQIGRSDYIGE